VRAARQVAPPRPPTAVAALDHIAAGRRPDGTDPAAPPATAGSGTVTVVIGCHDTDTEVLAAARLLAAAGLDATFVAAPGCCGQLADDLGAADLAADRQAATGALLATDTVIGLDPHCLPSLRTSRPDATVRDLWSVLVDRLDRLAFAGEAQTVTYHDPCLLARGEDVVSAPRQLLAAAGVTVAEPEQHGAATRCSGAGLGLPLLDPTAAAATGQHRAAQLAATTARPVTACRRAAAQLGTSPTLDDVPADLAVLLADRLRPATP
jgi:Fe-S oxidoreductase